MPQSFADELRSIPVSPSLGESLQRAYGFARDQALPAVTLEHLLLALTQDPESLPLLEAGNVDMTRLSADASSYLGRLMENGRQGEPGAEPRADPELLRVLQAAASATKKSPRRYIDGSIVLAAVVGDGKSPAAGLLKAHGLTFEHAIRALQQANAKARTRQFSTQAQQRPAPTLAAETRPEERPATERPEPSPPASRFTTEVPGGGAQSAEDILAAARARIQQRAASAANRGEAPAPAPKPVESRMPSAAATPASSAPPAAPAPPDEPAPQQPMAAQPVAAPAQPAAAPAPAPPPPAPEFQVPQPVAPVPGPPRPQPRPPDSPGRVLGRPVRPGEGPPRPPLPTGPGAGGRLTARLERIPGPGDRPGTPPAHPAAHPTGNGHLPGGFPAQAGHPRPPPPGGATRPGRPPQAAQAGQAGPIIESVPRRMRAGLASACEVRIARDRVDGLIAALNGPATRPDSYAVRALSVRLRAPNGGFVIESASPETQWIENASSMIHDDHAVWRWTVTPRRAGNGRLVIMVSARTIGHDGVAADTAPPDRVIEVKVRGSALRGLGRAAGWLVVAALGAAAGRFGAQLWDAGAQAVKMVAGW